jgi:cell division septal protein FtsQ
MSLSAMPAMMPNVRVEEENRMKVLKWLLWVVLALIAVLVIGGYLLSPPATPWFAAS